MQSLGYALRSRIKDDVPASSDSDDNVDDVVPPKAPIAPSLVFKVKAADVGTFDQAISDSDARFYLRRTLDEADPSARRAILYMKWRDFITIFADLTDQFDDKNRLRILKVALLGATRIRVASMAFKTFSEAITTMDGWYTRDTQLIEDVMETVLRSLALTPNSSVSDHIVDFESMWQRAQTFDGACGFTDRTIANLFLQSLRSDHQLFTKVVEQGPSFRSLAEVVTAAERQDLVLATLKTRRHHDQSIAHLSQTPCMPDSVRGRSAPALRAICRTKNRCCLCRAVGCSVMSCPRKLLADARDATQEAPGSKNASQ